MNFLASKPATIRMLLIGPTLIAITVFMVIPLLLMAYISFQTRDYSGGVLWGDFSYEAYLRILHALLTRYPDAPRYRTEEYEYVTDRPAIDLLTGGPEFRQATDAGESIDPWLASEAAGAAAFEAERAPYLLYR